MGGVLVIVAACGRGSGSTPASTAQVTASRGPAPGAPVTTGLRAAPRWETVTTLTGIGASDTAPFTILDDSIQWRVRWSCDTGRLRLASEPPPRRPAPLVEATCPGRGEGFAIVTGSVRLKVEASGPWRVVVDQQVDAPLREAPFEGMASAPVLGQGTFYDVEKMATGTARLYQRADGARVLRLEAFAVTTNVDLFVWLSEARAPRTSADAVAVPHVVLGNLKSTVGDQSYVLPPDLPPTKVASIVIWCEVTRNAYAAASIKG